MKTRQLASRRQVLRRAGLIFLVALMLFLLSGLMGFLAGCSSEVSPEDTLSDNLYERTYGALPFDLGGVRILDAQGTNWPNDDSIPIWTCWGSTTDEAKARLGTTLRTGVAADEFCDFGTVDFEDYAKLSS